MPDREPDLVCDLRTRPNQPFLFRLVDSMSPIHVDTDAARGAGFERPVMSGRFVLGVACRAILRTICDYDFTLIRGVEARFTAPMFPGDMIRTEMWQDRNIVSFRCIEPDRNVVLVDNGKCTLTG